VWKFERKVPSGNHKWTSCMITFNAKEFLAWIHNIHYLCVLLHACIPLLLSCQSFQKVHQIFPLPTLCNCHSGPLPHSKTIPYHPVHILLLHHQGTYSVLGFYKDTFGVLIYFHLSVRNFHRYTYPICTNLVPGKDIHKLTIVWCAKLYIQ